MPFPLVPLNPEQALTDQDPCPRKFPGHGDEIPFFGQYFLHFPDIARNGNQGSIRAYHSFGGVPVTGLNRGFLESCFRITDYPVLNAERRIVRG